MNDLQQTLARLYRELPSGGEEDTDGLESITLGIEDVLEFGVKVANIGKGTASTLPPYQLQFFQSLVYVQTLWDFYSAIAFDGLLSVFYNSTGRQIEVLRETLSRQQDPIASLFEEAYELLAPTFDIVPETNWVTRHRGDDPYELVAESATSRLEGLERSIGELQDESYARALNSYKVAKEQLAGEAI